MRKTPRITVLLGLTLCILLPDSLTAQQSNRNGVVYEAARNKIGLMRYCRNNTPLDPATAEKAIDAIKAGMRTYPVENALTREAGDRAERAGEDGFFDAVRRRDIASFAQRFGTTSAGLCQQWAEEALPARKPKPGRPALSIAAIEPIRTSPAAAPRAVNVAHTVVIPRAAERPPVPAKAPSQSTEEGLALQQPTATAAIPPHSYAVHFCPPPD